jgi:hypothetical protein
MTDPTNTVLALIARRPMLRLMQLADQLDMDVDAVDAIVRAQLIAGNLLEQEVVAPNQRPAMAYEVSGHFKATAAYRAIMVAADQAPGATQQAAQPAPAALSAFPSVPSSPLAAQASDGIARKPTHVNRAVALIKASGGTVSNTDMKAALGIVRSLSSFLRPGVQSGRLARDGDNWVLGAGKPQEPATPASASNQVNADAAHSPDLAMVVNINLIEEPTFTAQFGEIRVSGLRVVSEWNGMRELRDPQGRELIVDCTKRPVFVGDTKREVRAATVIKGHPDLVRELLPAGLKGAAPPAGGGADATPPRG